MVFIIKIPVRYNEHYKAMRMSELPPYAPKWMKSPKKKCEAMETRQIQVHTSW